MKTAAKVVIVGRTNVGKSTLFNRFSNRTKSLTKDEQGVTRDFLKEVVTWKKISFELIDTGGISLRPSKDLILEYVRKQALQLIDEAALILLVCDSTVGILPEDREIAKFLHKSGKKVLLIANKSDTKISQEHLYEFERFGFSDIFPVSAQHGTGCDEVKDAIIENISSHKEVAHEKPECNIVLLGKPNVGKSSLMNQLLKEERFIVTDQPGTTREAISERINFYHANLEFTDTPGLRRKRGITEPLEQMMTQSTLAAVERADIVLLLIDASEGTLSDQELKLAFYVISKHKALILLFNKYDKLAENEYAAQKLAHSIEEYPQLINKTVQLNISCKTGKNIGKILPLVQEVWDRNNQVFDDQELSFLFKETLTRKPLFKNGMKLEVYKAKQVRTAPITIVLIVNYPQFFEDTQLGFFENLMRKKYDLRGVPVRILTRKRGK